MLNGDLKKNAIAQFEATKSAYEHLGQKVGLQSEKLMNLRKNDGHNIITRIEALFSGIANKPKEFDKTFSDIKLNLKFLTIFSIRLRKTHVKLIYRLVVLLELE